MDNRFECGCERGGDCTKTSMCALQSALEDKDSEIEALKESRAEWERLWINASNAVLELQALLKEQEMTHEP